MAKIANDYCKKVYITDDNPRDENPNIIRNELSKYIQKENYQILEIDRLQSKKLYKMQIHKKLYW